MNENIPAMKTMNIPIMYFPPSPIIEDNDLKRER